MRNIIVLAAASAALTAAMAMPALAGQNDYCHDGDAIVQKADNNGHDTDYEGQHIKQNQDGIVAQIGNPEYKKVWHNGHYIYVIDGYTYSTVQKQDAKNDSDNAGGGDQTIKQYQLGFLGSVCGPAQNQDADNVSKKGWDNDQTIKQKQKAFVLLAVGTAQDQDAKNSTEKASHNDQSIKQSQSLFAFSTEGTAQEQDANNSVKKGHDNDQSISQSQSLGAGSTDGTVQSQTANNSVTEGHGNDQSISQTQHTVVLGGAGAL